jgi:plasmid stability protein
MAQLIVRNLPDAAKERLKRRAKSNGRSLEAEVREILTLAPEVTPAPANVGTAFVDEVIAKLRKIGITSKDIDELNDNIAELRRDQRVFDLEK